jgi:ferrochelatase
MLRPYDLRERKRYKGDCHATARALLEALGMPPERASICYHSGYGSEPRVGPQTIPVLRSLARKGMTSVAVVTPGLLSEGIEYSDIALRGRRVFLESGGRSYVIAEPVGDHPALIASLAATIRAGASPLARQQIARAGEPAPVATIPLFSVAARSRSPRPS